MMKACKEACLLFIVLAVNVTYNVKAFQTTSINATTIEIVSSRQNQRVITIPLIPHSVQRKRHLNLARRLERQNREAGYPARRRRRRESEQQPYSAPLYQGYGTHYVNLWCGTPPQRQTVIVDTGSSVTAFPCTGCHSYCGVPDYHVDSLYNESGSSTFVKFTCDNCIRGSCSYNSNECIMQQAYQEGSSWKAFEVQDYCYVGGSPTIDSRTANDTMVDQNPYDGQRFAFDLTFGCQTKLTGFFITQLEDGIMGMDISRSSYWWQMYEANQITHQSFSLCFSRNDIIDPSGGTKGGVMSLGGTDIRLHQTNMVYAITQSGPSGFYAVDIRKVWLREPDGGNSARPSRNNLTIIAINVTDTDLPSGSVIVDSGTTDTYFSATFGVAFQSAWKELMGGEEYSQTPLAITLEELQKTKPTILLQLYGDVDLNKAVKERSAEDAVVGLANDMDPDHPYDVIVAIPPSHYYEYNDYEQAYVSRFYVDDYYSGGTLGANTIMGHDVYFNIEQNCMGWAESDCDYASVPSTNHSTIITSSYPSPQEAGVSLLSPPPHNVASSPSPQKADVSPSSNAIYSQKSDQSWTPYFLLFLLATLS